MIRLRRSSTVGLFGRRRYEVELLDDADGHTVWRRHTTTPVTLIDPHVGVAEAWALVHAADAVWDRKSTDWSSLPGQPK